MANPLYKNATDGAYSEFQRFMNDMRGKNADDILNQMISSGQVNQSMLNQAQQVANKLQSVFKPFFGK